MKAKKIAISAFAFLVVASSAGCATKNAANRINHVGYTPNNVVSRAVNPTTANYNNTTQARNTSYTTNTTNNTASNAGRSTAYVDMYGNNSATSVNNNDLTSTVNRTVGKATASVNKAVNRATASVNRTAAGMSAVNTTDTEYSASNYKGTTGMSAPRAASGIRTGANTDPALQSRSDYSSAYNTGSAAFNSTVNSPSPSYYTGITNNTSISSNRTNESLSNNRANTLLSDNRTNTAVVTPSNRVNKNATTLPYTSINRSNAVETSSLTNSTNSATTTVTEKVTEPTKIKSNKKVKADKRHHDETTTTR